MHIRFTVTADDYDEFRRIYRAKLGGFLFRHAGKIELFGLVVFLAGLNWIFFVHHDVNWIFYVHHDRYYGFVVAILGLYVIGHYSGFAEAERLILLCDRRKSSYIIVPKRAIDPAEIASLRDLLRRKLKPLA